MKWHRLSPAIRKFSSLDKSATRFASYAIASRSELNEKPSDGGFSPYAPKVLPNLLCRRLKYPHSTLLNGSESPQTKTPILHIYSNGDLSASSCNWWEELGREVRVPDSKDLLSMLQHLKDMANATLSKFPNAQHTRISQTFRVGGTSGKGNYVLKCASSRDESRISSQNRTKFYLRMSILADKEICTIGPRKSTLGGLPHWVTIDVQLRARGGKSNDESTLSLDDLVTKLILDLSIALRGRVFTSELSWKAAVVTHLEENFATLALKEYLCFDELTLTTVQPQGQYHTKWLVAHDQSKDSPYLEPIGTRLMPDGFKSRHENTATTRKGSFGVATLTERPPREMFQYQVRPYNVHLSVIAQPQMPASPSDIANHFEKQHSESFSKDLVSVFDCFHAVVQKFPKHVKDPVTLKISKEAPAVRTKPKDSNSSPAFDLELRQATAAGSISASLHVYLQRSFWLALKPMIWKERLLKIKKIIFHMSPVDDAAMASLRNSPSQEKPRIAHEASHLADRASMIVEQVCGAVEFDDVALVPGMLAEAVLRVVRPQTTCFKLERVSVDVVIGDDPVILTKTVSLPDLGAPFSQPQRYIPAVDHVECPSRYFSNVTHATGRCNSSAGLSSRIGSFSRKMQLISSPTADYEIVQPLDTLIRNFEAAWCKSKANDAFTLQVLLHNALEHIPCGEEAVLVLSSSDDVSAMAIFSDGNVACRLKPLAQTILCHANTNPGDPVPIKCWLRLMGSPVRQNDDRFAVHEQLELMHDLLNQKLAQALDGHVFRDIHEAAKQIADVSHGARFEFADHMIVHTTTANVKLDRNITDSTVPTRQHGTAAERDDYEQHEADETFGPSPNDIDDSDSKPLIMRRSIDAGDDHNVLKQRSNMHIPSEDGSERKHVGALEKLLEELDRKLLSITTPNPEQQATDNEAIDSAKYGSSTSKMQRGVVIALGSNLGNRVEEIEKACRAIDADPDMRIVDTSFLYETKPMYVEDQGHFINGACEIETCLSPIQLLDRLQAIEQGHGRVKLVDKGPRNIDLDIAIFRDEVVDSERLTVPHMLMHEREFVLRPIEDLEQMRQWVNPRTKRSLLDIYDALLNPETPQQPEEPMYTVTPLTTDSFMYPRDRCRQTRVMSILNTTPDSFSDGGSNSLDLQSLRDTAAAHIAAGATIIDVGGQSSRPNAPDVTAEEEINRVLPAIAAIKSLPEAEGVIISVDTYRAAVAEAAVNAGAHIVNDISAGALDPQMLSTVARLGCTYVMMHMRGTPATMQNPENCKYESNFRNVIANELYGHIELAIKSGIRKWRIILDPGIGFAKTEEQNIALLRRGIVWRKVDEKTANSRLRRIHRQMRSMPQLVGCSRKGFIGKITGVAEPKDRAWGTAAAVTASIRQGADIVRVHDVKEMAQVAKMADALFRHDRNTH